MAKRCERQRDAFKIMCILTRKKITSPEIRVEKRVERREIINMLKQAADAINVSAWGFLSWWFMHI